MKTGAKVKFIGVGCKEQINWGGHTDPKGILEEGEEYTVSNFKLHSWHSTVYLKDIDGYFNSIWFEEKMMKIINIEATDIQDAWYQSISSILDNGFKYKIQHGSYVGQTRLEFDFITIYIKRPYSEPYDSMLPQIPIHLNIPNPVKNGYVEQYMPYLMTADIQDGEQYTYGSRMNAYNKIRTKNSCMTGNQVEHWIKVLKKTPNTNQAVLQVAQPDDCELPDPPCLRHIDMRIKDGELIFYPSFRSWDLWGGMPANLAGIAVLQKYMADEIGIESGPIVASSKGLHIYGYVEDLAKLRAGK